MKKGHIERTFFIEGYHLLSYVFIMGFYIPSTCANTSARSKGSRVWCLLFIIIRTQGTILRNHTTKQKRKKEIRSIVKTKC